MIVSPAHDVPSRARILLYVTYRTVSYRIVSYYLLRLLCYTEGPSTNTYPVT